jgi:hypothetical protein
VAEPAADVSHARGPKALLGNPWLIPGVAGLCLHLGTAVLRLGTFLPYPRLLDLASFYAGAQALRLGASPYAWGGTLDRLQRAIGVPFPLPNSPPAWLMLLSPLTCLPFPAAAWTWLSVLLLMLVASAWLLAALAGCRGPRERLAALIVVLSFGPVFLNLTLGQSGPIMLLAALVVGRSLLPEARGALAPLLSAVAAVTRLFPVTWLGVWPLLRRWRLFAASLGCLAALLVSTSVLAPRAGRDYWLRFLPQQASGYADEVSLDDQSLGALLFRLGRPQVYEVPGLSTTETRTVAWNAVAADPRILRLLGYLLAGGLVAAAALAVVRGAAAAPEGAFYLWVLCWLVPLPHMERYNLVLLLPAMAWLWARGQRSLVAVAYLLAGLSRLTHLWALALPWPWAPLASGCGLYATLLCGWAIAARLLHRQPAAEAKGNDR